MIRLVATLGVVLGVVMIWAGMTSSAEATRYGNGAYGACQYQACTIALGGEASVDLAITPVGAVTCTVDKDTLTVTTGSSTGYSLRVAASGVTNVLAGETASIAAVAGSPESPSVLGPNTWGYRVDGVAGFGVGPTVAVSDTGVPALVFAPLPLAGAAETVRQTASPASAQATDVWYGVCVSSNLPADTYSTSVTYTAVIN